MIGEKVIWDNDVNGARLVNMSNAWDDRVRANADPSVLRSWSGKTILYTGTADGFVSTAGTRRAFDAAGGTANANLRFFELPGMPHCVDLGTGAPGVPWYIGGVGNTLKPPTHWYMPRSRWYMPNSTGVDGPHHDALHALVEWVEGGASAEPPTELISTAFLDWPSLGKTRQRPVCAAPLKQTWDGVGDENELSSWSCQ
ncbi:unnamed protein product [Parascedosporium putredinis]|uniref:Carboxylic ester hydrolase n=1 Tax=Parascedosporium putredinis TaxID=1442378 RepID=A0A9P1MAL7_9PEZI|nr:unnamed protein product [Parascedosporium putredinis]CAI7994188.1 unnamed protein product [Parascedosporium putredinis]